MMSRERPFSPPSSYRPSLPISGEFHWVYVETASLDRVLAPPSAATTEAPVEPSPQTEPSAGATGAPKQNLTAGPGKQRRKGPGPRPRYEWPRIEKKAFELLDHYGGISPDEPELPSQEALVTKLLQFCGSEFGREPVPSTMRTYVTKWIVEYEGGKRSA